VDPVCRIKDEAMITATMAMGWYERHA
jgi:hypothetical protein